MSETEYGKCKLEELFAANETTQIICDRLNLSQAIVKKYRRHYVAQGSLTGARDFVVPKEKVTARKMEFLSSATLVLQSDLQKNMTATPAELRSSTINPCNSIQQDQNNKTDDHIQLSGIALTIPYSVKVYDRRTEEEIVEKQPWWSKDSNAATTNSIHFTNDAVERPYGFLSTYFESAVKLRGTTWPTVEHYFQAMKFLNSPFDFAAVQKVRTPAQAARIGKEWKSQRNDWPDVQDSIMYEALSAKFQQVPELKDLLIGTGTRLIIAHYKDDDGVAGQYWGIERSGRNMLGELLMKVRTSIITGTVVPLFKTKDNMAPVSQRSKRIEEIQKLMNSCFERVENIFSPFCPTSELSFFNASNEANVWCSISWELYEVLMVCDVLYDTTGGLFDPTAVKFGKWFVQYCQHGHCEAPPREEIDPWKPIIGWRKCVQCAEFSSTEIAHPSFAKSKECSNRNNDSSCFFVRKTDAKVTLDLCGLSKGWAVDFIADALQRELGLTDLFIEWGGDVAVRGVNRVEKEPWVCGIQEPTAAASRDFAHQLQLGGNPQQKSTNLNLERLAVVEVALEDGNGSTDRVALCTSGDYLSKCPVLGYHHITNPQSLQPLKAATTTTSNGEESLSHFPVVSATVLASSCMLADALATCCLLYQTVSVIHEHFVPPSTSSTSEGNIVPSNISIHRQKWQREVESCWHRVILISPTALDQIPSSTNKKIAPTWSKTIVKGREEISLIDSKKRNKKKNAKWLIVDSGSRKDSTGSFVTPSLLQDIKSFVYQVPKAVCIVLCPLRSSHSNCCISDNDAASGKSSASWFGCTMTSVIVLPVDIEKLQAESGVNQDPTMGKSHCFFVMHNSFLASVLQQRTMTPSSDKLPVRIVYLLEGQESVATKFGTGQFVSPSELQEEVFDSSEGHQASLCDGVVDSMKQVGDHFLVIMSCSANELTKLSFTEPILMRAGRDYRAGVMMARSPKVHRWPPSKLAVVMTCSLPPQDEPSNKTSSYSLFGTAVYNLDFTSYHPPILSGIALKNKRNMMLFSPWRRGAMHVRLHFIPNNSDGLKVLDGMGDGNGVGTQSTYFDNVSNIKDNTSMISSPAGNCQALKFNFNFSQSIALMDGVICLEDVCEINVSQKQQDVYLLLISPVQVKDQSYVELEKHQPDYPFILK